VVPVTALAFLTTSSLETVLLAGEDTQLRVYGLGAGGLCLDVRLFAEQSIQGIHVQESKVCEDGHPPRSILVWGGCEVAVVLVSCIEASLQTAAGNGESRVSDLHVVRGRAPDRIYDGAINPFSGSSGSLATAHNELVTMSWTKEGKAITIGNVAAPSRPLLFSASLRYLSRNSVLVAGGTVFGEILVWRCSFADAGTRCTLLHVFSGHEGSIFGVHLSDEIPGEHGSPRRLLASCSDDRSIRIWEVLDPPSEVGSKASEDQTVQARETGFGTNSIPNGDKQTDSPIAVAMGHVSRIWHIRFALPSMVAALNPCRLPLYSFGEDATAQRWCLDISSKQLMHQRTFANHDGKHLWSGAITSPVNGSPLIATGGADGKISLFDEGITGPSLTMVSPETLSLLETPGDGPKRRRNHDFLARYDFISHNLLLAATRSGKVLLGTFQDDSLAWEEVPVDGPWREHLKACTVVSSLGDGAGILGTATKRFFLYHGGALSSLGQAAGKVLRLLCAAKNKTEAVVLLTVHETNDVQLVTVDLTSHSISSETTLGGVDPRFVLTSAAMFHSLLVLGSRNGFLLILRKTEAGHRVAAKVGPRSDEAITSISPLPGQDDTCSSLSFITTHRDGKYGIYDICTSQDATTCSLRHETSPPFGPMIDRAWFVKRGSEPSELLLSGFKSTNFLVWNESTKEVVANLSCGGAHREFAHAMDEETGQLRLAFTKASTVFIYSQAQPRCRTIKPSLHGREIRAVAGTVMDGVAGSKGGPGAVSARYFATGAEDTVIRIWEHGNSGIRCAASIKMHETGIQALKWFTAPWGKYLVSSGGHEDLYIFRVKTLSADYAGLAVFREAAFPDKTADEDLRITDFDVRVEEGSREAESALVIVMAFSNSALKMYRYLPSDQRKTEKKWSTTSEKDRLKQEGFELLASGLYTGACITQARHLDIGSVLTSSTDGHVAIWGAKGEEFVLWRVIRVHQSCIKAMTVLKDDGVLGRPWLAVTTGDDNALGFTSFDATNDEGRPTDRQLVVRSAHAAAITGVVDVPGPMRRFATVSNDQRVKVWELEVQDMGGPEDRLTARLLRDFPSGVADPGSVETFGTKLIVGGIGIEIWDTELGK
jgi:WD repeat-containing protein 6